ncbi:MAG: PD-(D/E)XK motif protein [Pyrinomonadaceae bacterium]
MTTKTKVSELWNDLAGQMSATHGLLLRRCPTTVVPNMFIAVTSPEKFKCLAASVTDDIDIDVSRFTGLRDIAVEVTDKGPNRGEQFLIFKLLESRLDDIFAVLCDDLIAAVTTVGDDRILVRELLNRFEQWRLLFDKAGSQGLSPESQRGLYGELYLVRKCLEHGFDPLGIFECWTGPSGAIRDFQKGLSAIEVKTTIGSNHQRVRISSERQLDRSNLDRLYLFVVSLDQFQNAGESLNTLVDSIAERLDHIQLNRFRSKLFEYGFFDHDRALYEATGFAVRQEAVYEVRDDFPRIEEKDVRNGVGEVKYSIVVSNCEKFLVPDNYVFEGMNFV